jgi:hypothetical protein
MIVPYDDKFDRKVQLSAEAILTVRNVPAEQREAAMQGAREEARMVLLTEKAVDAGQRS